MNVYISIVLKTVVKDTLSEFLNGVLFEKTSYRRMINFEYNMFSRLPFWQHTGEFQMDEQTKGIIVRDIDLILVYVLNFNEL